MIDRPPLLEEPFAQTLSGKKTEHPFTIFNKPKQIKAGADDRNPSSQDCSPYPGEKQQKEPPKMVNQQEAEDTTVQHEKNPKKITHSDKQGLS